jgi:substrate import-associated zinc metallohydrolase lipoprotein
MKNLKYILLFLLPGLLLSSCQEEELSPNSVISVRGGNTDFDKWIYDNFTNPYNISIVYTWQDIEADMEHYVTPGEVAKCEPLAKIIQYLWLETFNEVKGINFLREHSPKRILMIGSWAYNSNNTYTLGTAESGMKITLYGVNYLDVEDLAASRDQIQRYMKTIIHEFAHILHQKKEFDPEFEKISNADYVLDSWSNNANSEPLAYDLGFISRYSRKNKYEDFVELLSFYVVYGQSFFDRVKEEAGEDGAAKIDQKFDIVTRYLRDTWALDIHQLRRVFEKRMNTVEMLDLTQSAI